VNILFLANHLNVGGISSYLFTLGRGLREKGHQVYLASSGGELEDKFSAAGITHIRVPLNTKKEVSVKIIYSFFRLKAEIKKLNIDLVHSQSRTTLVLGSLLSRYLGVGHIFTCHGFFKPKLSRRIFPAWPKKVIAISQEVKEHLVQDFKLGPQKISVINNGVDIASFGDFSGRAQARASLDIQDAPLIGIIARLSDVKGHIYLLRAMPGVLEKYPAAKLLIVGEGKMQERLIREADDLHINKNVLFLPEVKNTRDALAAMDIFVMPSLQEGLGLALMEAMAQGLAVIGSAVGGIKTLIQDDATGLLVKPADSVGISAAILKLLDDAGKRKRLGESARKFISDNFAQDKTVNQTEEVYQKCLKEKG